MRLYIVMILFIYGSHLLGQNTFVIDNNSTYVNVTGNTNIHLNNTKLVNNGQFNNPSGTVVIEGDAANNQTTIGGANSTTFYNLKINKSTNNAVLMKNIQVSNNLTFTSGQLELSNFDLQMADNATFTGINKDRYIKTNGTGVLKRKVGNSFVLFPVGKATFNPARLKNDGTVDIFNVRVIDNFFLGGTSGNAVTNNVVPKTWLISEEVPGGSDVTMRLIWRPNHVSTFDPNSSQITHYTSGQWQDLGTPTMATNDNAFSSDHRYREANNITSFSPFGVRSSGAILPVELLYFYGEQVSEGVQLDWQTASEINNSHFDVEWSTNGVDFERIGTVNGAGTTTDVRPDSYRDYDFLHPNPAIGENYYRLKQVDLDGEYEYTNVILITIDKLNTTSAINVKIFPNPTTDYFNVEASNSLGEMIRVFNVKGQIVKQINHQASITNIPVSELAGGTYFVKIGETVKKLVIVN